MDISWFSLGISLLTTAVGIGIAIGVFKSKIGVLEKDLNNMGKRFDDSIKSLKEEYIKNVTDRLKDSEKEIKELKEAFIRFEERVAGWQKSIIKRTAKPQ